MITNTSDEEELRCIVFLATERNRRYTEASLLVRAPGSYLLACSAFADSAKDTGHAVIQFLETTDGGESWQDPALIVEKESGLNVMAPSLLRLPDDSVGMVYLAKQSISHGRLCWRRSFDEGVNWSAPQVIADDGSYLICLHDCGLVLESGRILMPCFSTREGWAKDEHYRASCLYSDDCGETWQRSENAVDCPGRGAMEPVLYETRTGRVVLLLRTDQGQLWTAKSTDSGRTWGTAEPTSLESPQAPCMVRRIPETDLVLLARNSRNRKGAPSGGPRVPLTLSVSADEGTTWKEDCFVLEDDTQGTYAYPSIAFDGHSVLLTYYVTKYCAALCDTPDLRVSLCFRKIPFSTLGLS